MQAGLANYPFLKTKDNARGNSHQPLQPFRKVTTTTTAAIQAGTNAQAFLQTGPDTEAKTTKYQASAPYRWLIDSLDHPGARQALPRLLERQTATQSCFSLGEELRNREFGLQIVDPALVYREDEITWTDDELAEIQASPNWAVKIALMKGLVVKKYQHRDYRGVEFKIRLSGIINLATREMVPQGGGKNQSLPVGQDWLSGHRSPTLTVGHQAVAEGLVTESEYRMLHYYASLISLLCEVEGDSNAAYAAGGNSSLRQYLVPGANAVFQFQLDFRPRSQKPADVGQYVPGITDVAWEGLRILGVFAGGPTETPKAVQPHTPVAIEAPLPDFDADTTPAEEALATPASAGIF